MNRPDYWVVVTKEDRVENLTICSAFGTPIEDKRVIVRVGRLVADGGPKCNDYAGLKRAATSVRLARARGGTPLRVFPIYNFDEDYTFPQRFGDNKRWDMKNNEPALRSHRISSRA